MPQRSQEDRKSDRAWYREPYACRKAWRAREWGPLNQQIPKHPLRMIFMAGGYSHEMGMRWLKKKLFIGERPQCVEEIPAADVHWILDMAQARFSMEWVEGLRETYENFLKKAA